MYHQPFRRLCVSLGADITCGESALTIFPYYILIIHRIHEHQSVGLATSFLQGSKEEWSLVRRHPSERTFGVQLAGNKPGTLAATAEVFAKEFGYGPQGIDFVDVNCGCPIDLVFRSGSGSACTSLFSLCSQFLNS